MNFTLPTSQEKLKTMTLRIGADETEKQYLLDLLVRPCSLQGA